MTRQIDVFAARLSRHGNAAKAASEMGLQPGSGNGLLQRLRRELGWQSE